MSKMMTEYLVMEAIEEGKFDWDSTVVASEYAHYLGALDGTSRVWLAEGEERTVDELYTAMAVYSANDATAALAELVAGTEADFVRLMNDKAEELGMEDTVFVNSTGLPNSMLGQYIPAGDANDENEMSAYDTALLARALVMEYPKVLEYSSIPYKEVGYFEVDLINFNWMLPDHPEGQANAHAYEGVDGLKTGFTELAQYSFAGTAVNEEDMRLISVVMRTESMGARFVETAKLLDYGFDHFEHRDVAQEGDTVDDVQTLEVSKGKEKEVPVAIGENLTTIIHEDEADLYSVEYTLDEDLLDEEGMLVAPIEEGDTLGQVKIVYNGEHDHGMIQQGASEPTVPLVATAEVEEAGWFRMLMRSAGDFFGSIWSGIVDTVKGWF
jgi:serine-type D-Ala-D-Ala carboxypeptidase (penicillin-binding protein 5/6)